MIIDTLNINKDIKGHTIFLLFGIYDNLLRCEFGVFKSRVNGTDFLFSIIFPTELFQGI